MKNSAERLKNVLFIIFILVVVGLILYNGYLFYNQYEQYSEYLWSGYANATVLKTYKGTLVGIVLKTFAEILGAYIGTLLTSTFAEGVIALKKMAGIPINEDKDQ